MSEGVKRDLRAARIAETEDKLLRSATVLFVQQGYAATTLAEVAEHAGVGARTVYVRFGTKAALLKRAVDVALVGDSAPVDVAGREWFERALTAPSVEERVTALCDGSRQMMARAGDILAVAVQAAATEPEIAAAAQAGREATRANIRVFWERMAADGMAEGDLDWLTDTTALLVHPETYLLGRHMIGWDLGAYERWLVTSVTRLTVPSRTC